MIDEAAVRARGGLCGARLLRGGTMPGIDLSLIAAAVSRPRQTVARALLASCLWLGATGLSCVLAQDKTINRSVSLCFSPADALVPLPSRPTKGMTPEGRVRLS